MKLKRVWIATFILLAVYSLFAGNIKNQTKEVDWEKVRAAFEAYIMYPSSENAKLFLDALPHDKLNLERGNPSKAFDFIYDNYTIWNNEMMAGERNSIEAAFRLLAYSDGVFTEYLLESMGSVVRINPRMFLEILDKYKDRNYVKEKDYLVYFTSGETYSDKPRAEAYELEMRVKALESVTERKYQAIKEKCIGELKKAIKEIKAIK